MQFNGILMHYMRRRDWDTPQPFRSLQPPTCKILNSHGLYWVGATTWYAACLSWMKIWNSEFDDSTNGTEYFYLFTIENKYTYTYDHHFPISEDEELLNYRLQISSFYGSLILMVCLYSRVSNWYKLWALCVNIR